MSTANSEYSNTYIEVTVRVIERVKNTSTQIGEHKRAHMELNKPEYTGLSRWVMENAISVRMAALFPNKKESTYDT